MKLTVFSCPFYICAMATLLAVAQTALSQSSGAIESLRPRRALGPATVIRSIRAEKAGGGARVVIETDGTVEFRDFTLADPFRIVVDLAVRRSAVANKVIAAKAPPVERIRAGQPAGDTVRVVLDAKESVDYRVSREGTALIITVGNAERDTDGREPVVESPRKAEVRVAGVRIDSGSVGSREPESEEVKAMLHRIEELEARVRELEAGRAASQSPAALPATAVASTTSATATEKHSQAQHEGLQSVTPRMEIQGYADVSFRASDEKGKTSSFAVGQLDLFITSRLSDKFSVLGELVLDVNRQNDFSFEIHRLMLRYAPNDYFNLGVGRYHTAIGYYNSAYHHGQWFQTAANRPFIFAFEGQGGVLPIHNVGLTATGRIPSGAAGLRYIAEVGNGRASRSKLDTAVQTAVDENNGKSFNLGLISRPAGAPGLQMGLSVYRDRLAPEGLPRVGQIISAAHVVYRNSDYEWLNEAIDIRHNVEGRRVLHAPAFYTQIARRIGEAWPYFRYQYMNVPDDDPINGDVGRRNGPSVGLRYNLSEFAALKIQYDRTARRRFKSIDELVLQLGFTF